MRAKSPGPKGQEPGAQEPRARGPIAGSIGADKREMAISPEVDGHQTQSLKPGRNVGNHKSDTRDSAEFEALNSGVVDGHQLRNLGGSTRLSTRSCRTAHRTGTRSCRTARRIRSRRAIRPRIPRSARAARPCTRSALACPCRTRWRVGCGSLPPRFLSVRFSGISAALPILEPNRGAYVFPVMLTPASNAHVHFIRVGAFSPLRKRRVKAFPFRPPSPPGNACWAPLEGQPAIHHVPQPRRPRTQRLSAVSPGGSALVRGASERSVYARVER